MGGWVVGRGSKALIWRGLRGGEVVARALVKMSAYERLREQFRLRVECEALKDQVAELWMRSVGDANEGTLNELFCAFMARVLSEEECELMGIEEGEVGAAQLPEFKRVLEKMIQALETPTTFQDVSGRDTGKDP